MSEVIYQHEDYRVELADDTLIISSQHGRSEVHFVNLSTVPSAETQYVMDRNQPLNIADFVYVAGYPIRKGAFPALYFHSPEKHTINGMASDLSLTEPTTATVNGGSATDFTKSADRYQPP